ncbi:MAG: hypothetical protein V8T64_03690 [Roseburia intestinalis]
MLYYLGKGTEFKKEDCKEYKTIEGALKAAAKNEELVVWDENGNVIGSLTDNVPEGALETNPDGSVNTYNADGNKVGTMTAEELKAATTLTDEKDAEGQQGNAGASTDDENGGTGGNTPVEPENGQNGANSEQENEQQTSGDGDDVAGQQTSGDGDDAAEQETSGDDESKTEEQVSDSDTIYPEKTTRAIVDCDGALNLRRSASWGNESRDNRIMFTNPGKSRLSGVFLYPNGLICFKVKFLKSLKPQNDASSFFDLDSMQKAKICVDHFRGVPCILCGENSFAIFWLTMSKSHSIPTRLKH